MRKRSRRDAALSSFVKRPKKRQRTTVISGGVTRTFVQRSLGTPLAITERKYYDATFAATALPVGLATAAAGELDPAAGTLFSPVTGDDFNNRSGRKTQVVNIRMRGLFAVAVQADQAALDTSPFIRLLLIQDKQTNTAQLNSEDVINAVGVYGLQNPAFFGRFRVLKDKTFKLGYPIPVYDGTNIEQSGMHVPFKLNVKFRKPVTVHFNGTNGGTVADIVDNSFHLIGWTSVTTLAPTITYYCRTTFLDQ